jgi:hypothetical protein
MAIIGKRGDAPALQERREFQQGHIFIRGKLSENLPRDAKGRRAVMGLLYGPRQGKRLLAEVIHRSKS